MSLFQEIALSWKGQEYVVAPNNVMMMLAKVEDILTLGELIQHSQKGGAPLIKLSMAYGCMLRYAGAKVRDDEVYQSMFAAGDGSKTEAGEITQMLLSMMIPPEEFHTKEGDQGKPQATEAS